MRTIFTCILFLAVANLPAQNTYHVSKTGNDANTGLSWNNAFATLQKALLVATNDGDAIYVAKGTYYPDEGPGQIDNNRKSSFTFDGNGIIVLGGFEGVEGQYTRNWITNPVILSGEIQQDDDRINNSYHVIVVNDLLNGTNRLDGFTIKEGYANGDTNEEKIGAGLYANDNITLTGDKLVISFCIFTKNLAEQSGGAIFNKGNTIEKIDECSFTNNYANEGAGIANYGTFYMTIQRCKFETNIGFTGVCIYNRASSPIIADCIFKSNTASGGACITNLALGSPSLGGGEVCRPEFVNCAFTNNVGIVLLNTSSLGSETKPAIVNCTINSGTYAALRNNVYSSFQITNSIIWGTVVNFQDPPVISYSIVKNSFSGNIWNSNIGTNGGNNSEADPRFVDELNGNLRLLCTSPAIDAGDNEANAYPFDLDANLRIINNQIDIGVFESVYGKDTEAPVVKTKNITVTLGPEGTILLRNNIVEDGSTDNCSIASISVSPFILNCNNVGENTVVQTVVDANGNSAKATAVITVIDNTNPTAICKNITVQLDANGTVTVDPAQVDNGSADACGIKSISLSKTTFNCSNIGANPVTLTVVDNNNNRSTCNATITVEDNLPPAAVCKNITVQLDADGTVTVNPSQVNNNSTDNCSINNFSLSKTTFNCANIGTNQVTLTVTDHNNNESSCIATITVEDTIAPLAKCRNITVALDAGGNAIITTADVDDGSTDACGIKSRVLSKTSFNCSDKGNNTIILTVTDNNGNIATCTANVLVVDNIPPIISSVVPGSAFLWPADRKMKSVTVAIASTDNCPGTTCRITGVVIKQGTFAGDNIEPDWEITGANTVNLRAEIPRKGLSRIYTITVACTDAAGNTTTAATDVVVAHNITSPTSGTAVKAGSTVNFTGSFWDVAGNKHSANWLIDDKVTVKGIVTEPSGSKDGAITGSYKFTVPGVYKLRMNTTDQKGVTSYANTNGDLEAIVVVYDPNGGYTYGGGYYSSPAGAFKQNPTLTGDVSYGFTINYYKNATYPKGETQFNFKLDEFEFNAVNFEYLAITNAMAQFKGTGKITGGQSGIGFTMTVIDGGLDGTGIDKIRMKIYNKNTGAVIYDNQPGAGDAELPTVAVGFNSTIVISGSVSSTAVVAREEQLPGNITANDLDVRVYPNPSTNHFMLKVNSSKKKEKISVLVIDQTGRVIEQQSGLLSGTVLRIGEQYRPGVYYVKVIQGTEAREIKLIKLSE